MTKKDIIRKIGEVTISIILSTSSAVGTVMAMEQTVNCSPVCECIPANQEEGGSSYDRSSN